MGNPISEYKPCENLRPFVELYWEGTFNLNGSENLSMQMIPNGCVELIIHLSDQHCNLYNAYGWSQTPDYLIMGLFTQPYQVKFNTPVKVFAIRFKPEGIYNIFGVPASNFTDSFGDMTMVLGREFRDFSSRIREERSIVHMLQRTENYLMRGLEQQKIEMSYVNRAAELIRNTKGIKIEEIPNQVSIGLRQLEREFKAKLGISPKNYLRITRINEVIRLLASNRTMSLTAVAYDCGYSDQSHFINDFKRIAGEKPTIFVRENQRFISSPGLSYYSD